MKRTLSPWSISFLLLLSYAASLAQPRLGGFPDGGEECGQDHMQQRLYKQHPELLRLQRSLEAQARLLFLQRSQVPTPERSTDFVLPVVFHIIHDNGPENIGDDVVLQALDHLNEAFANTGFYDQGNGVDTRIQFCLAKQDPDGLPTSGINRIASHLTDLDFDDDLELKNLIRWDPLHYINIWLVRSIEGGTIAGYAFLSGSHGTPQDGLVVVSTLLSYLGSGHSTLVHEMGHYLGLYHTFQNGCANADCLFDGDQVCDTPPDNSTVTLPACDAVVNSCFSDTQSGFTTDQNDLNWNFLDYGNRPCRSGFTQGQSDRMHFFIENVRQSLLDSRACQEPCLNPLLAFFDTTSSIVDVGTTLNFQNLSTNATTFQWYIDGQWWSSATNPSLAFNQPGMFTITLEAFNDDPNCFDTFEFDIEVVCPIAASFITSALYPQPGQTVSFTNTASGAVGFTWTLDGVTQAQTQDFSFTPDQPGQYQVCLIASNGLCEKQFCQWVFALEKTNSVDCEGSFFTYFGELGVDEASYFLLPSASGSFYLAGKRGTSSLLMEISSEGQVLKSRTFDFTSGSDFIANLMVDDEGYLVGSARDQLNTNTVNVLFKLDWNTDQFIWAKSLANPAYNRFDGVLQNPKNGNYWFYGLTTDDIDNYLLEMDRNDGQVLWQYISDYGANADVYSDHFITSDGVYFVGQGRFDSPLDKIRPTLSKFDFDGNLLWARIHLRPVDHSSRLYNMSLLVDNDTIVNCGRGTFSGDDLSNSRLLLYKTDLQGNLYWARQYSIPGASFTGGYKIDPLPDGYVISGLFREAGGGFRNFVARLGKDGQVIWAKTIVISISDLSPTAPLTVVDNGFIYYASETEAYDINSNDDLLFAKIAIDGTFQNEDCELVKDLVLTEQFISNPYDGPELPLQIIDSYSFQSAMYLVDDSNVPAKEINNCSCDSCPNGFPLHGVPDATISVGESHCVDGQVALQLRLCNADSVALPVGTPLTFYDGDPRTSAAAVLAQASTNVAVEPGTCVDFEWTLPLPPNVLVFAVVNDAGTTPTPYDLEKDFPNSGIPECDFANNLDTFSIGSDAPVLDLGPDVIVCDFEVALLDAGPGFNHYQWSNGEHTRQITVWLPGMYSVTVTDGCGLTQTASINVIENPATVLTFQPDTLYTCPGDTVWMSVSGYQSYHWFPEGLVGCDSCGVTWAVTHVDTCLTLLVADENGCYSIDTLCLAIGKDTLSLEYEELICPGDSLTFFGNWVSQPGTYEHLSIEGDCFIRTVLVLGWRQPPSATFAQRPECPYQLDGRIWVDSTIGTGPFQYVWGPSGTTGPILQDVGAGTYTLSITDGLGCVGVDTVFLMGAPRPHVEGTVTHVRCYGASDGRVVVWSDYPGLLYSFRGSPFTSQTVYEGIGSGGWQIFAMDSLGCIWEEFFTVEEPPPLEVELPAEILMDCGDTLRMEPMASATGLSYQWSPNLWISCIDCERPYIWPEGDTVYRLLVTNSNGCTATAATSIAVNLTPRIYVPNAFSPNSDGINDTFFLLGDCVDEIELMRIFNRWGDKVFEARNIPLNDPSVGWDGSFKGKLANPEVFVFYANVRNRDGTLTMVKGAVTLLR